MQQADARILLSGWRVLKTMGQLGGSLQQSESACAPLYQDLSSIECCMLSSASGWCWLQGSTMQPFEYIAG